MSYIQYKKTGGGKIIIAAATLHIGYFYLPEKGILILVLL